MKRFLKGLGGRWRVRAESRRRRALHKAIAEKKLRESEEATIWKSGRGGGHPDH